MSVIIILLIASISVASLFLAAFIWSVKSGQLDDDFSPPLRILFDDHVKVTDKEKSAQPITKTQISNQN